MPFLQALVEVHERPSSHVVPSGLTTWTHTFADGSQTLVTHGPPCPAQSESSWQLGGGGQAQYCATLPAALPAATVSRAKSPGALAGSNEGSYTSGGLTGMRTPWAAVLRSTCCRYPSLRPM